ncbi:unnamed protein product [Periconia digitata]|uniref:Uncharacterized protein n=1 Tax=Periconia digitata TaxID=1303443 RepID=A0A9W4XRP0_9PLEO|nr:unnamed protein product [Periconia digitata]
MHVIPSIQQNNDIFPPKFRTPYIVTFRAFEQPQHSRRRRRLRLSISIGPPPIPENRTSSKNSRDHESLKCCSFRPKATSVRFISCPDLSFKILCSSSKNSRKHVSTTLIVSNKRNNNGHGPKSIVLDPPKTICTSSTNCPEIMIHARINLNKTNMDCVQKVFEKSFKFLLQIPSKNSPC